MAAGKASIPFSGLTIFHRHLLYIPKRQTHRKIVIVFALLWGFFSGTRIMDLFLIPHLGLDKPR